MTKHTQGPWIVSWSDHDNNGPVYFIDNVKIGTSDKEHDANARLIAAAPELLEALKALDADWTKYFPDGPDTKSKNSGIVNIHPDHIRLWKKIRSAIEKAEGR